jgi:pimeloyl-ACP methyl ester carboxylesterase
MSYEPVRSPRHAELTVRGLKHRLTWWGEPTDTPFVLLHGFLDCADTWQFLVDCLPRSWSCVAPDWRGFGGSEWAPGGYWFPDYFADLEALLAALVPDSRARVIGHSMGANIAQLYAGIRPGRLAWLANLEGIGLARTEASLAPLRYEQWLNELREPPREGRYESVAQLASILRSRNTRLTSERAEFIARAWSRPVDAAGSDGGRVRLASDPRHRLVNPVLYRLDEAEACWARVEIPMLFLAGGNSPHPVRHGATLERLRSQFRDLRMVTIAGVGHMMHHEDPAAVAAHIVEFERTCPVPQALAPAQPLVRPAKQ